MRWNESRISSSVTGSLSGACSRNRSQAMARNQPSPNGIISTAPRSFVTPVNVSCGARVRRTSASRMCVSYCLPTKSMPTSCRTVLCAPSHPTTYFARTVSPSAHCTVTPSSSWVSPTTSAPRTIGTPSSSARICSTCSVPLCGSDEQHRESARQLAQVDRGPARRRDLVDRHPACQQLVGHTARVEQLEGARMHGKRPGDVGLVGALFEQPDLDAAEREFTRQHQAGRPSADHHNIGSVHDAG